MRALMGAAVALVAACEGNIHAGAAMGGVPGLPGEPPDPRFPVDPPPVDGPFVTPSPFACQGGAPSELPLRRLSRTEYLNAMRDLIERSMPASAAMVLQAVQAELSAVPADELVAPGNDSHGGFRRLDQRVQLPHVDATYTAAVAVGRELTATAARRAELMGACATDASTANDAPCLNDFVARFGAMAARRPLTPAELSFFVRPAQSTPVAQAAVSDVVALLLASPRFLYLVESGGTAVSGNVYRLDAWELASRLSFHFWQTSPDAELEGLAASGALLDDAVYRAQVTRLASDARANAVFDSFFSEWFRLEELPALDGRTTDPVYRAFAGPDLPTASLRPDMLSDVLGMVRAARLRGAPVVELLTDNQSYAAPGSQLATLYGAASGAALGPERAGLITRAAFVANGSANTRPVMKGYRIRSALLCDTVPPPPSGVDANTPDLAPDLTTREVVEALTEQPQSSCVACHGTQLNALGFVTEGFDALARHRTGQRLFDATGAVSATKAVDTSATPRVVVADPRLASGPHQVTTRMAESGKFQTCFARQYFRFTARRAEQGADGCSLAQLDAQARAGAPLFVLLEAAVLDAAFRRRTF